MPYLRDAKGGRDDTVPLGAVRTAPSGEWSRPTDPHGSPTNSSTGKGSQDASTARPSAMMAASSSISPAPREVRGGRTGPALFPSSVTPAFTRATA